MIDAHQLLGGRYRLQQAIGRGGMADVYLAFDEKRQAEVAVKILREDMAEEPDLARRFRQEAEALARLDHPNIVHFYAFEQDGHLAYIVMDFIDGTTLRWRLFDRKGPLPLEEVTRIVRDLGSALHYAHMNGFVHRDLKPGNVMLQRDGRTLLTDFGIAHALESVTMTGPTIGTPAYMSPEQIEGDELDMRSDVYSMGALLFEMATGKRPFTGEEPGLTTAGTSHRIQEAHLSLAPPNPRDLNPALPQAAAAVILRALAKRPADRWPDVLSLRRAWDAAVGARGASAPVKNPELEELARAEQPVKARRPPIFWIAPAVLALAAVAIVAVLALAGREPPTGAAAAATQQVAAAKMTRVSEPTASKTAAATAKPARTPGGGVKVSSGLLVETPAAIQMTAPTLPPVPDTETSTGAQGGPEPTIAPTWTPYTPPTAAPSPSPTSPPQATSRPQPARSPTPPAPVSGGVILRWPPWGERIYGESAFKWDDEPGFKLGANEAYELIVWEPNQSGLKDGRSPVGARLDRAMDVNLSGVERVLGLTPGQPYLWGVRLLANGAPVRMLSEGRAFMYERKGGGAAAPHPSCVGDDCEK